MPDTKDYAGLAALSICESLLIALNEHKILPDDEIKSILTDAATTHENAVGPEVDRQTHQAVAALINRIIKTGN